ncbi:hypothetical protein GVAV_001023 [Gurleya vavrai]
MSPLEINKLNSLSTSKDTNFLLNRENPLFKLSKLKEFHQILLALEEFTNNTSIKMQAQICELIDLFEFKTKINLEHIEDNFQKNFYLTLLYSNIESSKQIHIYNNKKEYVLYFLIYTMECYFYICQKIYYGSEVNNVFINFIKFFLKSKHVLKLIFSTLTENSKIFQDLKRIIYEKNYSIKKYLMYINFNYLKKNLSLKDTDEENIKKASYVLKSNNFFEINEFKILFKLIATRVFFRFQNSDNNKLTINSSNLVSETNLDILNQSMQSYAVFENVFDKIIYTQSKPGIIQTFEFYEEILKKFTNSFSE